MEVRTRAFMAFSSQRGVSMRVAVIDGQGGGIGKNIVGRLRQELGPDLELIALGTNANATLAMVRAGANHGATGENAICRTAPQVDVIVGTINIICAHSMLGEVTPAMAEAVACSPARKLLLPLTRLDLEVVGVVPEPLPHYVDLLITRVKSMWGGGERV
jgi:NAD(P)-dependent dehydrogenase (short-subunit alcohol dehydrogenase family)